MSLHNPISPLRALYVQKVLPAVYDDSLSYYEVLAKTQEKLNEVISDTNDVSALVLELQQAIMDFIHGGYTDTFEEYLDEWFAENSDEFVQRLIDEGVIPEVSDIQEDLQGVHASISVLQAEDVSIRNDMVAADTAIRNDMVAADTAIRNDMVAADNVLTNTKVPYPVVGATPSYGTSGQVLATNADGTTDWQDPVVPDDTISAQVITQWLNAHPEATTTVQDGSITTAKLANGAVTDEKLAQSGGVLDKLSALNDVIEGNIELLTEQSSNLFPAYDFYESGAFNLNNDGSFAVKALDAQSLYPQSSPYSFTGDASQRYTLSLDYYTDQSAGNTGNGIYIGFVYTDDTTQTLALPNTASSFTHATITTSNNKTVAGIYFRAGTSTGNTFYLKNIMLNKGIAEEEFVSYHSAVDSFARNEIEENRYLMSEMSQRTQNLINSDILLNFSGWVKEEINGDIVYTGLSQYITNIVLLENLSQDKIYTASFEAYTDAETVASGNGFRIYYDYTDGTSLSQYIQNSATEWTEISLTNPLGKTISQFKIAAASGSAGNTWHIRRFQIRHGNYVKEYTPYVTAKDSVLSERIEQLPFNSLSWWNNGRIKMAMHQGMRSNAQPIGNCILSFTTAGINKAWAIETDLRATADNKWVCFHDRNVDVLTNGTGNVADLTLNQIKALYYINQNTGEISDQKVPTFQEYLQICKTYNCVPLIEWKIRPTLEQCIEVISILKAYGFFESDYMFLADAQNTSKVLRKVTNAPALQVVSSIEGASELIEYVIGANIQNWGIDFDRYIGDAITEEIITQAHNAKMICGVYSVNNSSDVKQWFERGIDIVTSDYITDLND